MLLGDIRRTASRHAVLEHPYWSGGSGPIAAEEQLDAARPVAGFLQWVVHTVL